MGKDKKLIKILKLKKYSNATNFLGSDCGIQKENMSMNGADYEREGICGYFG